MTKDIINLIKQRNKEYKSLKQLKTNNLNFLETKKKFRSRKNQVNNEIRKQKAHFFKQNWDIAGSDSKKQWKVINTLFNQNNNKKFLKSIVLDKNLITDPLEIANRFNKYFINVGQSIVASMVEERNDGDLTYDFKEIQCNHSMFLYKTNTSEVGQIILKLNKDSAAGYDNINVKDILLIQEKMVPILTILINDIFSSGIFPKKLKIGKVISTKTET